MTGVRAVAAAVTLSLGLHTGLALGLRALGFGPDEPLPALFVDLVEPVVTVWEAPRLHRPAPVRPRATRPVAPAAPVAPPSEATPAPSATAPPTLAPPPAPPTLPARPLAKPEPAPAPAPPRAPAAPAAALAREPAREPSAPAAAIAPSRADAGHGTTSAPPSLPPPPGHAATSPGSPVAEATGGGGVGAGERPAASAPGSIASGGEATGAASRGPSTLAALPGGQGGSIPSEYDGYVGALRRRIQERLTYPWLAVRQGVHGTVELEVSLDPAGRLAAITVVGREPPGVLRDAAMRAVRDATPFPFPAGVVARALTIRLPVVFELR